MTDNVVGILPPSKLDVEHFFGGCPLCGWNDGYHIVGERTVFVCVSHKTRWEADVPYLYSLGVLASNGKGAGPGGTGT